MARVLSNMAGGRLIESVQINTTPHAPTMPEDSNVLRPSDDRLGFVMQRTIAATRYAARARTTAVGFTAVESQ